MQVVIDPGGRVRYVYDDALAALPDSVGAATVRRASHVEPAEGGWAADMAPVGGPVLGPYRLRADALEAERQWLDRWLRGGSS